MQARYYLDNTTLTAPEDGRIVNLQVRPGMVSGIYRIGGIAALIALFRRTSSTCGPASRSRSTGTHGVKLGNFVARQILP